MAVVPPSLTAAVLTGTNHGFFTRLGGVSEGLYGSLNCGLGSNDARASVLENRRRVAHAIGGAGAALVTAHQVHSADTVAVTAVWPPEDAPRADALVTDRPGIVLGVLTADCVPILLADQVQGVIGAAHAGWRGAAGGIIESVVAAMARLGAEPARISAAIGPAIRQRSYEVGPEFAQHFADAPDLLIPAPRAGRWRFDLPAYVARRLRTSGVTAIQDLACDTLSEPERFFSNRRGVLAGEPDYGRMIAVIALA